MDEEKPICGVCCFYLDAGDGGGKCRRYPPTAVSQIFEYEEEWGSQEVRCDFPETAVDSWCGEYRPVASRTEGH